MSVIRPKALLLASVGTLAFILFATAGEPTGDVAAMKKIETLQREAQGLYPRGMLQATIRATNVRTLGVLDAEVTAFWDEGVSRTEARYVEERVAPGDSRTVREEMVEIIRGKTSLFFGVPTRQAFVLERQEEPVFEYLACIPRHCWFGGDGASGRQWTWFLERHAETMPVDRTTHTEVDGSLVRISQVVTKDGKQVADAVSVFDLDLAGMCISFESDSTIGKNQSDYVWTLDDQGRPLLQSSRWSYTHRDGGKRGAETTITRFEPDYVVEESQFSHDLAQFPLGTPIIDQRVSPMRSFKTKEGSTLDLAK